MLCLKLAESHSRSDKARKLNPSPKVCPNPHRAPPTEPLTRRTSAHSVKHWAPSSAVSELQRQASCFLVPSRDLRVPPWPPAPGGLAVLALLCWAPRAQGLHDWDLLLCLGQAAQEQSSSCLRQKRLWGGEGQAWSADLCSSLPWPLHLCITHEPVFLLELLVSHSHLCLFYLKLSLLSFEARDQTNKREFGSCNVWSTFCSEVKLKIAPKPIHRQSFWRPFGRI